MDYRFTSNERDAGEYTRPCPLPRRTAVTYGVENPVDVSSFCDSSSQPSAHFHRKPHPGTSAAAAAAAVSERSIHLDYENCRRAQASETIPYTRHRSTSGIPMTCLDSTNSGCSLMGSRSAPSFAHDCGKLGSQKHLSRASDNDRVNENPHPTMLSLCPSELGVAYASSSVARLQMESRNSFDVTFRTHPSAAR